jgi:fibrillarin-like pre-rRNA processing protein
VKIQKLFDGVYRIGEDIATLNLTPGKRVYGEKLVRWEGKEYRLWNPYRSKLAAAIHLGLEQLPLSKSAKVLYLGAAQGTTASHVSDIAREGVVYCVEFSPRAMQSLLTLAEARENIIPILADASKPDSYSYLLEKVDVVYQDIAQAEQSEILLKNLRSYLKEGGHFMHVIKARSIDVTAKPEEVFEKEVKKLKEAGLEVIQKLRLEPYEKDHLFVLGRA